MGVSTLMVFNMANTNHSPNIYNNILFLFSEMCLEMIEQCIGDSCTCKPGYEPDDCCCPTGQKRNHNQMCICKMTEESPVNGVCPGKFAYSI